MITVNCILWLAVFYVIGNIIGKVGIIRKRTKGVD